MSTKRPSFPPFTRAADTGSAGKVEELKQNFTGATQVARALGLVSPLGSVWRRIAPNWASAQCASPERGQAFGCGRPQASGRGKGSGPLVGGSPPACGENGRQNRKSGQRAFPASGLSCWRLAIPAVLTLRRDGAEDRSAVADSGLRTAVSVRGTAELRGG